MKHNILKNIHTFTFCIILQGTAVSLMKSLAASDDPRAQHLVSCAQYNLGRAYFEGFGVPQSDEEAEHWWLLAAKDGDPDGSIKAQSTLGMFYARIGEDSYNLEKVID